MEDLSALRARVTPEMLSYILRAVGGQRESRSDQWRH
jgi:hypothetical protein